MKPNAFGQFDYVIGSMILHHLEPFSRFAEALDDALKPNGKAFFLENNANSRTLVWFRENLVGRFGIPKYGDMDEFPLTPHEVDLLRKRFSVRQEFPEMVFFYLVSLYLLNNKLEKFFRWLDQACLKNNLMVKYSYRQILLLEKACGATNRDHREGGASANTA